MTSVTEGTRRTVGLAGTLLLFGLFGIAGCGEKPKPPESIERTERAGVDSLVDYYVRQKAGTSDGVAPEVRARLVEELQQLRGAAAVGEKSLTSEYENAIELSRLELLARAGAEAAGVYAAPTHAELMQAYASYQQSLPASEYHAAHILVANEILAAAIIAELDSGKAFADVARARSADDSRINGGDLGWIYPGHLPAEFFEVLKTLKPGEYSRRPIHTAYGWHVIQLLETKAEEPPAFEQVKAQLAVNLQRERYQAFLEESGKIPQ